MERALHIMGDGPVQSVMPIGLHSTVFGGRSLVLN